MIKDLVLVNYPGPLAVIPLPTGKNVGPATISKKQVRGSINAILNAPLLIVPIPILLVDFLLPPQVLLFLTKQLRKVVEEFALGPKRCPYVNLKLFVAIGLLPDYPVLLWTRKAQIPLLLETLYPLVTVVLGLRLRFRWAKFLTKPPSVS